MSKTRTTLPNFIIGGVNKAGTSAIFAYLNAHPDACGSSVKEINFFKGDDHGDPVDNMDTYAACFRHCPSDKRIIFEASPYLQRGRAVARQIKRVLPDVKLAFMLREPASRLYSFYKARTAGQRMTSNMSFDEYVDKCLAYSVGRESPKSLGLSTRQLRALETSRYSTYLREFYEIFSKDNIRILFLDNLKSKPAMLMQELCEFLDIDGGYYDEYSFRKINETYRPKSKRLHKDALRLNKRMQVFFHRRQRLKARLVRAYKWLNKDAATSEPMSAAVKERLMNYYRDSNSDLAALLADYDDLPRWLQRDRSVT